MSTQSISETELPQYFDVVEWFAYSNYLKNELEAIDVKGNPQRIKILGIKYTERELEKALDTTFRVPKQIGNFHKSIINWVKKNTYTEPGTLVEIHRTFEGHTTTKLLSFWEFEKDKIRVLEYLEGKYEDYVNSEKILRKKFTKDNVWAFFWYYKGIATSENSSDEDKDNSINAIILLIGTLLLLDGNKAKAKYFEEIQVEIDQMKTSSLYEKQHQVQLKQLSEKINQFLNFTPKKIFSNLSKTLKSLLIMAIMGVITILLIVGLKSYHYPVNTGQNTQDTVSDPFHGATPLGPPPFTSEIAPPSVYDLISNDPCIDRIVSEIQKAEELFINSLRVSDTSEIFTSLNNAIKLDPSFSDAYARRGYLQLKCNNFSEAEKDLTLAIKHYNKSYHYYFDRALARYRMGKYEDALEDINQAFVFFPEKSKGYTCYKNLWLYKALINMNLGNYEAAILDYRELQKDTNTADNYIMIGYLHGQLEEFEDAISSLQIARQYKELPQRELHLIYRTIAINYYRIATNKKAQDNTSYKITHLEKAVLFADSALHYANSRADSINTLNLKDSCKFVFSEIGIELE